MKTSKWKIISRSVLLAAGLFMAVDSQAWWYGNRYHGGYYRNTGYYGGLYRGGYYRNVGYPYGAYYRAYPRCTYMQQCYPNGTCFNKRICR